MTPVRRFRSVLLTLAFAMSIALVSVGSREALARPGGGQSFRGSSRSTSSTPSRPSYTPSYHSSPSYTPSSPSYHSTPSTPSYHPSGSSDSSTTNWSHTPSYSYPGSGGPSPPTSSFSDPTGGGGGGGGGGSMTKFFFFVFVGVAAFIVAIWVWVLVRRSRQQDWVSGLGAEAAVIMAEQAVTRRPASIEGALGSIHAKDKQFSRAVLEDFLYALFAAIHTARGTGELRLYAPYLDESALAPLAARAVSGVHNIIIGSMRIDEVRLNEASRRVLLSVVFTANYTEGTGDEARSYYVEERWKLGRSVDAQSRKPEAARVVGCPNCGAPLENLVGEKCRYCSMATTNGDFDWRVETIEEVEREERGPILTGTNEEVGTQDPTKVALDVQERYANLVARDAAFSWSAFVARVDLVFRTFHEAWSNRELAPMRPYLTDALFETERYWIETYLAQKLRNITEQRHLVSVQIARALTDAFYDSITVRVFAECIDYTVDDAGTVVGGRRDKLRPYSEYWTFIRSKNRTGAPRSEPGCPNCGAPTEKLNMAGECASCGKKVTMGEFDWVLSRMEQDEVFELDG